METELYYLEANSMYRLLLLCLCLFMILLDCESKNEHIELPHLKLVDNAKFKISSLLCVYNIILN